MSQNATGQKPEDQTTAQALSTNKKADKKSKQQEEKAYAFEGNGNLFTSKTRRSVSEADREWKTLATKISNDKGAKLIAKAEHADLTGELQRLLRRWALECPLNIAWYERKKRRRQILWIGGNAVVLAITTAGLVAIGVSGLKAFNAAGPSNAAVAVGAILSFSVAALLGLLKLFAGIADVKAQYAIFWEASSALKEDLYRLEDDWLSKTSVDPGVWNRESTFIELRAALRAQIRRARVQVAKEQAAFFKTFKSPSELIDAAGGALDALDSRTKQLLAVKAAATKGVSGSFGADTGSHEALDSILAVRRADSGGDDVSTLNLDLARLRFIHASRGDKDGAMAKKIEDTELALAHARERSEIANTVADDLTRRA